MQVNQEIEETQDKCSTILIMQHHKLTLNTEHKVTNSFFEQLTSHQFHKLSFDLLLY